MHFKNFGTLACGVLLTLGVCSCGANDAPGGLQSTFTNHSALSATDTSAFNFESSLQDWGTSNGSVKLAGGTNGAGPVYAGTGSLGVHLAGTSADQYLQVATYSPGTFAASSFISYHVWIPSGTLVYILQPFLQDGDNYRFTSFNVYNTSGLPSDGWVQAFVPVPSDATMVKSVGVAAKCSGACAFDMYVDAVGPA